MSQDVYILGGGQSDFAVNWSKQGNTLESLIEQGVREAGQAASINLGDVDSIHVGNFIAELNADQGHLGGLVAEVLPELRGKPIGRHEAACASGSLAILGARSDLLAGVADLACVIGIEWMRNLPGRQAAINLNCAAWHAKENKPDRLVWPHLFSSLVDEYTERYGLDRRHLEAITEKNLRNAKANPNAQTRSWQWQPQHFKTSSPENPAIDGHIHRYDCAQITDGTAVIFLANGQKAAEYAKNRGLNLDQIPRIKGYGHTTARISFAGKCQDAPREGYLFPHMAKAARDAFQRAEVSGWQELDGFEVHDCFNITEYSIIEHLGITSPGEAFKAIEEGWTSKGGRIPINPSGGLMGLGHPVGATGVRMALDAAKQVQGQAQDMQITGAKNFGTLNIGGSATTVVSFVIGI